MAEVIRVLKGDCRDVLPTLPAESVHCVVTSPPYWGLRDYGTAKWEGGDPECDHKRFNAYISGVVGTTEAQDNSKFFKAICGKCGARHIDSQIGLESSFTDYIETVTGVFREVRRVLRKDGTCWVNMGDSYAGAAAGGWRDGAFSADGGLPGGRNRNGTPNGHGLKPKDLCGIPWRLAFALQADGWYLRSDIIWSKPNPMPESVTDRPTKAHEYLFLLTRSERYYYDGDAIREPHQEPERSGTPEKMWSPNVATNEQMVNGGFGRGKYTHRIYNLAGRNRRTVWEIATSPFPEAHFATFPPALVEPCIKAGTSEKGCCAKCRAPWVREVEKQFKSDGKSAKRGTFRDVNDHRSEFGTDHGSWDVTTIGWLPSCSCKEIDRSSAFWRGLAEVDRSKIPDTVPCTVLDPFGGVGTTGLVADRLGRNAILIELNPQYANMAEQRLRDDAGMFAMVAAE